MSGRHLRPGGDTSDHTLGAQLEIAKSLVVGERAGLVSFLPSQCPPSRKGFKKADGSQPLDGGKYISSFSWEKNDPKKSEGSGPFPSETPLGNPLREPLSYTPSGTPFVYSFGNPLGQPSKEPLRGTPPETLPLSLGSR